jgi:oligopeptide/dipeptide ABC transporter ATP-binding protein
VSTGSSPRLGGSTAAAAPLDRPEPQDSDALLRLEGLQVHFPIRSGLLDTILRRTRGVVRAVDGIDLDLRRGEVLALVGESGSGKTTTGRVIVKLTRATAGSVRFEGRDVTNLGRSSALSAYRRRVQLIFQDPYETLNPKQSINDFVMEPLIVNDLGFDAADRRRRVLGALEAAGLRPAADFAARYPHELSGGQRQRVVIAGALVMSPELIVADEPVSMLDVSIRTELLRLMLDLRAERGLTYLFITHDLSLAWVIADRIAVMYLGRILEIGPAEQVIRSPHNPYTQALVSVSPSPEPPSPGERARRTILVGETPDAAHIPSGCRFHPRCPYVFDRCRVEEPPLFDVGPGQQAACWLAEGGRALPVLPPRTIGDVVIPGIAGPDGPVVDSPAEAQRAAAFADVGPQSASATAAAADDTAAAAIDRPVPAVHPSTDEDRTQPG